MINITREHPWSIRPMHVAALALLLGLAACSEAPLRESKASDTLVSDTTVADTLVIDTLPGDTALRVIVNGRSMVWSGADTNAVILLERGVQADYLSVIGQRSTGGSHEIVQILLDGFDGVGAYVLDDRGYGHSGVGIYDIRDSLGESSWWSDGRVADTAWVTSYDSSSGHIEGTFRFVGRHFGAHVDSVVVDSGTFKGMVKEFTPTIPDCVSDSLVGDCHTYDTTPCRGTVNPATSDTSVGAEVNGNPWMMSSTWPHNWSYIETRQGPIYLSIGGGLRSDSAGATAERLQVWVYGFKGPGVYPMRRNATNGYSYGVYQCAPDQEFIPLGWPGDQVTVASWDSVTGEVAGSFQFRASRIDGSGAGVRVTNGAFHLKVPTH